MSFIYSATEEEFIRDFYGKLSDDQIAKTLNRSIRAIQAKRQLMGLSKEKVQLSKHAFCYELRVQGYTFKRIAEIVGISQRMARKAVYKFLPYTGNRPKTIVKQSKFNYETHTPESEQRTNAQDFSNLERSERTA